jgi:hypothetical protein
MADAGLATMTVEIGAGEPVLIAEGDHYRRFASDCTLRFPGGPAERVAVIVDETRDAAGKPVRTVLFPPGVV